MADESSTHPPPAAFYDVHEGNPFDLVGALAGVLRGRGRGQTGRYVPPGAGPEGLLGLAVGR
ncbi:hypothetical protein H7827_27855 [Streptomyces sp. JH002]|uniref:hypothetical protein n=1 Tax=Streptomyces sp. JH002 TaxID=2763259 RepID=UPI003D803439